MAFFGGQVTDDIYWEWVAHYATRLKASTAAASAQPESDTWIVPAKALMRGKVLKEDSLYWWVGDATINGEKVPPHITIAYKPNFSRPKEISPPRIEDPAPVAEIPLPEAVPEYLAEPTAIPEPEPAEYFPEAEVISEPELPEAQIEKVSEPKRSLWHRLFRKQS